jgi:hypothetical protein
VTIPLLAVGFGVGALASQLGAITVSAVPDDDSAEVGGIQNTVTNLGASVGTALAGAILISGLTGAFLKDIEQSAAIPASVKQQANVKLSGGVPFISDDDLDKALDKAGVDQKTADAATSAYQDARLTGLRTSLAALALLALVSLFFTGRIPAAPARAAPT